MPRRRTGNCYRCLIRFAWTGEPRLKDALCPFCRQRLALTTPLARSMTSNRTPDTAPTITTEGATT